MKKSLIAGAIAFAFGPAFAQEVSTFDLGTVVVTPQRFSYPVNNVPTSVTVIDRKQIEQSPLSTVPELLSREAGINLRDLFGNNASNATVDLRGIGAAAKSNTLVLLDGKRIADIDLSSVQWAAIPLDMIERIEIVRGSGAALYGEGATSGVINIVTRMPTTMGMQGSARLRFGSYDTQEAQVYAAHRNEKFEWSVAASDYDSDGYRKNNRNQQTSVLGIGRWRSDIGDITLRLGADRQDIRLPGPRQIEPDMGVNEYAADPRAARTPKDYATRDGNTYALAWDRKLGASQLSSEISLRTKRQTSYYDFNGFPDYRDTNLSVLGITPRGKFVAEVGGMAHEFIVGVDFHHWRYDMKKSNSPSNIGQPINHVTATENTFAWYLQDSVTLKPGTTLTGALRTESLTISADDSYDATAPGGGGGSAAPAANQHAHQYAFELGLRQRLSDTTSAFGKLGRSYRYANVDEIYESSASFTNQFQFLRPQWALDRQLGLDYANGSTAGRLAFFHVDTRDEIHLDPFSQGIGNTNLPPTRRYGLELDGKWQANASWRAGMNYAYTVSKFREGVLPGWAGVTRANVDIAGKTVPLVPRHKLSLNAVYVMDKSTTFSLSATHVSKQYMDNDEPNDLGVTIPAYTLVDLKLEKSMGAWKAALAVNNALNERYYTYAVRSQYDADRYNVYPLAGRTLSASLQYAF